MFSANNIPASRRNGASVLSRQLFGSHLCRWILLLFVAILATNSAAAQQLPGNFKFITREGEPTSLFDEIGALKSDTMVHLLLFDPDCEHCQEVIAGMIADEKLSAGIHNGQDAVIAVYPVPEIPEEDDPNLLIYNRLSGELPADWVVGIDNGSIFNTDACVWDQLPLLLHFPASSLLP
jgi:hypothetical protein